MHDTHPSRTRVTLLVGYAFGFLMGCGDDTGTGGSSSTTTAGAGGTTSVTGSGGDGGAPTTTSSAGTGGEGGSWENVDPLAGILPVAELQSGFSFTEGSVFLPSLGLFRFSDIPQSRIHEIGVDGITVWRDDSNQTNGNAVAPNGDIVMCEHASRSVTRSPAAGAPDVTLVADAYRGMRFNSPNDVIVRSDGNIYITDPTYGLGGGTQEIPVRGVFRIAPGGEVSLVGQDFDQPNGIALSPDETILYVTDSAAGGLFTFDVSPDGSTGPQTVLNDTVGGSDGMAVDDGGNLYLTTGNGVDVFRADGTFRGNIPVPQQPANCAFGGADRTTLLITARTSVYTVTLNVPGKP